MAQFVVPIRQATHITIQVCIYKQKKNAHKHAHTHTHTHTSTSVIKLI